MNVASLELCKTLHELSRRDNTFFVWVTDGENRHCITAEEARLEEWKPVCPAYDLGYLIRKADCVIKPHNTSTGKWQANNSFGGSIQIADTPENAVAKLCIVLSKAAEGGNDG